MTYNYSHVLKTISGVDKVLGYITCLLSPINVLIFFHDSLFKYLSSYKKIQNGFLPLQI